MQITQPKKEALKFSCTVSLTADEIDAKTNERLQELGKTVKMPGFRPGKIPMTLLKSKYGQAVQGEVLELVVNESSLKAINENNLRPAMRPKIEIKTFEEGKGLEYDLEIELLPEITVADLSGIKIEKLTAKPDAKTVTETLEKIAASNKTSEKVEEARAAKKGDIVVIDFDGTVNGEAFPGMKGSDFPLELGSKSFVDTFEDQLVGSKVGDKKSVKVTFPKDYGHDKLQGVEAVFAVEVKELRAPVAAKIDDEFAKKLGFEGLAQVEEAVSQQIQAEYDQLSRMNVKRALLDQLDETHDFEVPAGMVRAEFVNIWHQLNPNKPHNHDADDHKFETEEENAEYEAIAERRVKLGLVLAEIGRQNKIEVSNQELQQAVINEARRYPGQEKQVFEFYQQNPQALESVKAPIYEDKVVDFILERSKVDSREVTIDELTKAAEQEAPVKAKAGSKAKKSGK
jgi:trigger factor